MNRSQRIPKGQNALVPRRVGQGPNAQKGPNSRTNGESKLQMAPSSQARVERVLAPKFSQPKMFKRGDGRVLVRHREYIADIQGQSAFTNVQYPVQPGIPTTFPWLSGIASNYESYCFKRLKFQYRARSPSTQTGSVFMVIDYDALDAAPSDKTEFASNFDTVDCSPWQDVTFDADVKDLMKLPQRYIRQGTIASSDLKTYDVGTLNVASQGNTAAAIGELWVEYEVELITPQKPGPPLSLKIQSGGTVSKTAPLGDAPVYTGNLSVVVTTVANKAVLTFASKGQYLITFNVVGTGLTEPVTTGSTIYALTEIGDAVQNAAATAERYIIIINVSAPGQTLIIDEAGSTTITSYALRIAQYVFANA